ncbi:MAG: hypothetical protein ACK5MZ_00410 [Aestuariibaculum sp.]
MKDKFRYKGLTGSIEFSKEDNIFYGKILDIDDLISYKACTINELETAFKKEVDCYLEENNLSYDDYFKNLLDEDKLPPDKIGTNNIITGLLINFIKKNTTHSCEDSFSFKNEYVEIKLNTSGFEEKIINDSIEDFKLLGCYADKESKVYYSDRVTFHYYAITDEYIKISMPKNLFIYLRNDLLNIKPIKTNSKVNLSNEQLKLF